MLAFHLSITEFIEFLYLGYKAHLKTGKVTTIERVENLLFQTIITIIRYTLPKMIFRLLLIMLFFAFSAAAKPIYQYVKSDGSIAFTDRKPIKHSYSIYRTGCYACQLRSSLNWHKIPIYPDKYHLEIATASKQHNVDPALVRAMIHAESAFKANARSKKGAIGLMQLMPATAKYMGIKRPTQPSQNILGGVKYLSYLLEKFNGNIRLATAAYNAGPNAVKKYRGIPPFAETKAYVERVGILHNRYRVAINKKKRKISPS